MNVEQILKDIVSSKSNTRQNALNSLNKAYPRHIVRLCCIACLNDLDLLIRSSALDLLAGTRINSDFHYFVKAINDPDFLVRTSAVECVSTFYTPRAIKLLKKVAETDTNPLVKRYAIDGLSDILPEEERLPYLSTLLEEDNCDYVTAFLNVCLFNMTGDTTYQEAALSFLEPSLTDASLYMTRQAKDWGIPTKDMTEELDNLKRTRLKLMIKAAEWLSREHNLPIPEKVQYLFKNKKKLLHGIVNYNLLPSDSEFFYYRFNPKWIAKHWDDIDQSEYLIESFPSHYKIFKDGSISHLGPDPN